MYMFTYFSKKLTFKNPYVILFQRVYILPLRNENRASKESLAPLSKVYILPLRNENKVIPYDPSQTQSSLYPTFKEWKLRR